MGVDQFQTRVPVDRQVIIKTDRNIVSLGSCFADNIGNKLKDSGFNTTVNPFGTLFHPYSIFETLDPDAVLEEDFYLESSQYAHHFRLPKTFFASSKDELEKEWKARHRKLHDELRGQSILLLTLGSSFIYERGRRFVTNCHQRPSSEFEKRLTSIEDMHQAWESVFAKLPKDLIVVLSLSPVRHLKDGLVQNNLSKSLLRVLIDEMQKSSPDRIHYFPAYEILLDELRDYRFFARDMLHPSDVARDYIWDIFQDCYLDESARLRVETWRKLEARLNHRPLHPDSEDFNDFQADLTRDLKKFRER